MKKTTFTLFIVAFLAVGQGFASGVTDIELSYIDGFTVARIGIEGPVRFMHQTEEAKDGKPFRVIVDVLSATHALGAKNFFVLPKCPVKGIRTSQYTVKPEMIVRVVFDMDNDRIYRVDSDSNSIRVSFPDRSTKKFATWSTSGVVAARAATEERRVAKAEKVERRPVEPAAKVSAAKEKSVAELNRSINDDRLLSLQDSSSSAVKRPEPAKPSVSSKPPVAAQPRSQAKAPVVAKASPPKTSEKKPVTREFETSTPYGPDVDWALLEKDREEAAAKAVAAAAVPVPVSVSADSGKLSETSPKPKAKAPVKVEPKPAEPKKADVKKATPVKKTTTTKKATTPRPTVTSPKGVLASAPSSQPVPASRERTPKASDQAGEKPAKTKVKAKAAPVEKAKADSSAQVSGKKDAVPDRKSTSRFRRYPISSKKIKGTLVAEFPKRLVIKYKSRSYRDPFETLINDTKVYNNPVEKRVPNVEGLRLVGIIQSGTGKNSALFEDKTGYGYILRTGDKVQKGYVLRVENDRVYFQIFEYGWSRTVALNLED